MKTVGTHNGVFHADDVFAFAVLCYVLEEPVNLTRSRDPEELAACDILIDVGDVFDSAKGRFDHHQGEGKPQPRGNGVPYSSFGLVWRHYGMRFVSKARPDWPAGDVEKLFVLMDERIVQGIDAADCGMALVADPSDKVADIRSTSLSSVISGFNPVRTPTSKPLEEDFQNNFVTASAFAFGAMWRQLQYLAAELQFAALVEQALVAPADPRIIELEEGGSWQAIVCAYSQPLYVVYLAETGDTWMVQCVPPTAGSFDKRKALPEAWGGKRDAALAQITDVQDAVFCHGGLFICGARSKDGAMRLAKMAAEA